MAPEPPGIAAAQPQPAGAVDTGHRIDVLIPVYNAEATVRSAVESICAQTERSILIHIVDDGSTDATPRILAELAGDDARIRIHHKPNGGIVDALNYGLGFCTAEYIARHDGDDLAYPERLAVQLDWLTQHPDAVAVGAGVRHIDEHGQPTGEVVRLISPDLADPCQVPSQEPYIIHPFLMVRRAAVEAAGGYRHVHHAEDTDLYWRLSEHGRMHNLPDVLGDYRVHSNSVSSASIVNGRIAAAYAQLAALSYRRRKRSQPDIAFPKGLHRLHEAKDLAQVMAVAGADLEPEEMQYLREASAAKLLELASYRPFELEASDCRTIGEIARQGLGHLTRNNSALQSRRLSGTAARLAAAGRMTDAMALLPPGLLPSFAARYMLRARALSGIKRRLRQRTGRRGPSK
ncbi:glycosyltransferase family 2 protein [Glacieibacterium sp.]|uniref:glycosyltransferase family 2 protein n=1 Tax=Glacieibacterium sp. TaxID=2860237 RepID=UPI003B004ACC